MLTIADVIPVCRLLPLFLCCLMACADDEPKISPFAKASNIEIAGNSTTDVWGYQDAGKEYAIVGDLSAASANFSIVDVSDPANPELASSTLYPAFDMKAWRHYLYIVNGARDSTTQDEGVIFDIRDPFHPVAVGNFPSCHNIFIDDRGYLYSSGRNDFINSEQLTFGISIYDLNNNPMQPELVWTSDLPPSHDMTVTGDRMYDFHGTLGTLIFDVSNRSAPVLLSTIDPPVETFDHSGWPTEDGRYLFITNEFAATEGLEITVLEGPDITIWNITDPAEPILVAEIHDDLSRVHNLYIIDNLAYVSYYSAGFKIFDVADPVNPELIYQFDTNQQIEADSNDGFNGAFGVYPFTPSGNVYVSDINFDLFIFTPPN